MLPTMSPEKANGIRTDFIDIVFNGSAPGPEAGKFVDVENDQGESVNVGEWTKRPDGRWVLRFTFVEVVGRCL